MRIITRKIHPGFMATCVRTILQKQINFPLRSRYFSQKPDGFVQLKKKEFHVNPGFGTFRTTSNVGCIIKPANPHEFPDANRALVYIYGDSSASSKDINIELTGECKDVLTINAFPENHAMYYEVHLPIKYDLEIKLFNDADVHINGMEADEVNINTFNGNINTKGLKSHNIHITTKMGSIIADGTLQGNLFVNAKKTNITAKRLQGMAMSIDAEELDTAINSSYMTQGEITAHRGNICLKNLHGCTDLVLRKGNVSISGLHGQIAGFVGKGNMDVQITDVTSNSTLHVNEGNMSIAILEDPR
ncbi:protein FAM185A [Palaemon carinicauda]|uniref:protein FAM185A n=1 Tax=Palaemon carinicauda TaxID=392227 RepID=UPI0035B68FE8